MQHEIFGTKSEILETDITFDTIYAKPYVPKEYIEDIKKADILIIPEENCKDQGDYLFPETTTEFLEYIREKIPSDVSVDIPVSDEEYKKIELHSASVTLATLIVKDVLLPLAINLIAAFLIDLAKKYLKKPEDLNVKVSIISEETKTKKSKSITYEGPVSGVKEALVQSSKDLFKDNQNDNIGY